MPESSGDLSDRAADSPERRDSLAGGGFRSECDSPGRSCKPFFIGVIGDFSAAQPDRAPLRERRFLSVSRSGLNELIAAVRPRLDYSVPNKMGGDSPTLAIQLEFHSLSGFDLINVARQIPPLRKLLELREHLVDLQSKTDDTSTRRALDELLAGSNVQKDSERESTIDENVQFTLYRPRVVEPETWHSLLVFVHLDDLPFDVSADEPLPIDVVRQRAATLLDDSMGSYRETSAESELPLPREGEILLVPQMHGVVFHPPQQSLLWVGKVCHREFQLKATRRLDNQTARGHLDVFLGPLILASIPIPFRVSGGVRPPETLADRDTARPYHKIFASYSRRDAHAVECCERITAALGHKLLLDTKSLRAGEVWSEGLEGLIREADVFQLFWSQNSMHSPFVEREWRFALGLDRVEFVRPTYWEEPLPVDRQRNLPPAALSQLHFQRLVLPDVTT